MSYEMSSAQADLPFSSSKFRKMLQQPWDSTLYRNGIVDNCCFNPEYLVLYGPRITPRFSPLTIMGDSVYAFRRVSRQLLQQTRKWAIS